MECFGKDYSESTSSVQFSSVQSLSRVQLFATPWIAARQVHHQLPEFTQTHIHQVSDAIQPPHVESWLIGKDFDAGRDCGQEEKGTMEDEMAGCHHWLDGLESEWTPGVGDGQGGLAFWDSWGHKESDTNEQLIWSDLIWIIKDLLCECN